jgi:(1->4)-alpha-D-glucan 1-alpha-D-glucosylmutase
MYLPLSTYRLQLHAGFTFDAARDLAPYLAQLGVGACYTSPYFAATPGSTHGYDVCNHNAINPELGGPTAHAQFVDRLAALGLGHMLDFVPNHMGIGTATNLWWRDVLENGPGSSGARFFDVDWAPVKAALKSKLLLPILGDQYGRVLERGELSLAFADGQLVVKYFDYELPLNPKLAPQVLRRAVAPLTAELGADSPQLHEFLSILTSLQNLPDLTDGEQPAGALAADERQREKEVARARLARLVADCPAIATLVDGAVRDVNGEVGRPESFNALHELLEQQAYRLSYWRTASHEINYRRFFDVNELAGLRVEDPEVFAATHELLGQLLKNGLVQAVRIDHPDGLLDPARYFTMLQQLGGGDLYVVAEKILSSHEMLPARWPVAGTTGYAYLNDLNGVFIHAGEAKRMRRTYTKLTGQTDSFDEVQYESKRLIMETAMASELNVLAHALSRIAEGNRRSRDFTLDSLRDTLTEVIACFPVYRTYVDEEGWTPGDRAVVDRAIVRARRRNPAMEASLFDFLREVMMSRSPENAAGAPGAESRAIDRRTGYPPADAVEAGARLHFAMKFQQFTGPVQAKGLEDTAFFRYNLLLSLSEVGGDLERYGRGVDEFHESNAARLRQRPFEMLATATHDTKLGEDTRARINVLSEIPDEWSREVTRWMRMNGAHRPLVDGEPAPDRNDEYRFYQALVGIWPPDVPGSDAAHVSGSFRLPPDLGDIVERIRAYMLKAVKEAKRHTSWLTPNEEYEQAVARFVDRVLSGPGGAKFLPAVAPLARRVARVGMINGLAQVVLKIGSPGVPDFYQGSELWDFSLVDPDNRRPVDFERRRRFLDTLDALLGLASPERAAAVAELMTRWEDGRIKLLVTTVGLRLRREWPDVFLSGGYSPLVTDVTVPAGLIAFARILHGRAALFVAPRLAAPLVINSGGNSGVSTGTSPAAVPLGGDAWKTSRIMLPPDLHGRTFEHRITGSQVLPTSAGGEEWIFAGQVFDTVPVGILTSAQV